MTVTHNEITKTQTQIRYIGPTSSNHSSYMAVSIMFAEDFDMSSLPKSVRAKRRMTIDCTPREGNVKNEAGVKRLRRILKALEGTPVEINMPYSNNITEEEFFARVT